MKKIISTVAAMLVAGFIFAEGASYTVKSVKGKVTCQTGSDKWVELKEGKNLSAATVVNTGLNSTLVLADENGKEITIKPMKKGSIDSLSKMSVASNGIRRTNNIRNEVASKTDGASKGVATASSRASDAQGDLDWDE